jgi:hypothetical protein
MIVMKLHTGCFMLVLIMAILAGAAYGNAELKLEVAHSIVSGFDGSGLSIPVTLSGSDAVLQLVIVESLDWDIPPWRQDEVPSPEERFVQGLDPLVSVSPQEYCQEGNNTVIWNGKDREGRIVPFGWYRFYVLAFVPGSVSDSLDYGIEHRSEIHTLAAAIVSGKIVGFDVQPHYPLIHFTDMSVTSVYATVYLSDNFFVHSTEAPFTEGDEIGVFSPRGDLVGAFLQYSRLFSLGSFSVYGDDPATPEINGMREGEPMTFVIWDYQTNTELPARAAFASADSLYRNGARYTLESLHVIEETAVSYVPPAPFILFQNSPNPANSTATLSFNLPTPGSTDLAVYSLTGQKVRTLISRHLSAGKHSVSWDGRDDAGRSVSSGVYLSRLESGGKAAVGKMLLMK